MQNEEKPSEQPSEQIPATKEFLEQHPAAHLVVRGEVQEESGMKPAVVRTPEGDLAVRQDNEGSPGEGPNQPPTTIIGNTQ